MKIAVYLGSRNGARPEYVQAARSLGAWIGDKGHTLVYGGSRGGLMGELASAVLNHGGKVTGVLPDVDEIMNLKQKGLTEYIYTKDVAERRSKMIELADAFAVLPGGLGTLDEITEVLSLSENDVGLSLLPLSHTFEMMTYVAGALHCGGTLYLNESVRTVKKNLRDKRPTILVTVPLILQTLHKEILNTAKKQGRLEQLQKALRLSGSLRKIGLDMSRRFFGEVRELLGGRLHTIICGGAALDPELIRFFQALGIEVLQGYGITECSPVVSVNRLGKNVVGSVGQPLPCCEVKLEGREICVRGENVSPGYYKDAQATAESFRDGWFHTGDLGWLDRKGNLFFEGRIKNLIILANGENVSPEELEEKLYQTEGILDAAVYEKDGRITAELFVDRALIPDIPAAWRIVSPINRSLASFKQIGEIVLRETEFEKTATRKIKRYKLKGS